MSITLKSLHLVNFKGVRDLELTFHDGDNMVCGENGTGKTTLFDAFTWLLFGKDSKDKSDSNFNIKTLDSNGCPILRLEHSVTGILDVDGKDLKLERRYQEVWEKPSGTTIENLKNHKTVFLINDVKQPTKRDYDAKINSVIAENVFRMITNPFYFTRLKPEEQKAMLLDMAGNVTDDDVAKLQPEYAEFLAALEGTAIIEKANEVSARKSACNQELKLIPSKIETAEKLKPNEENWDAINRELENKRKALKEVEALMKNDKSSKNEQLFEQRNSIQQQINKKKEEQTKREGALKEAADKQYNSDINAANNAASQERIKIQEQINAKNEDLTKREGIVRQETGAAYNEAKSKVSNIEAQICSKEKEIKQLKDNKPDLESDVTDAKANVEETEKSLTEKNNEIELLRTEYKKIYNSTVAFGDDAFICPTCKRPLEADDVEAKQKELEQTFNSDKAKKLKANKEKGKALSDKIKDLEKTLERQKKSLANKESHVIDNEDKTSKSENELVILRTELVSAKANVPDEPDYKTAIINDSECKRISNEISKLKAEYDAVVAVEVDKPDYKAIEKADADLIAIKNDITELQNQLDAIKEPEVSDNDGNDDIIPLDTQKENLENDIADLNKRLGKKDTLERAIKEISNLENERVALNAEVAELEGWEYQALQFQKAKDAELLKRINGLFQIVSFSFVSSQLNGGEKITCMCTVNGTPYPDVNNAGKINAGLDIINAICKANGVCAPIFVDNAESVNNVLHTDSQKILLTVTNDKTITLK